MPHTDFLLNGERVPIKEALKQSLKWDRQWPWPYALLRSMVQRDQNQSFTPSKFYGCDRKLWLSINRDYAVDPANAFARLRGTMFHSIFENVVLDTEAESLGYKPLVEVNLSRPIKVDGVWRLVTGRIDLGDPDRNHLSDYKTTKRLFPPYPKPDDIGKLKLYRWMGLVHGLNFERGELLYIEPHTGKMEVARVLLKDAPEAWIEQRIRAIAPIYNGHIPEVIDLEDQWMCGYCDVAAECLELAHERGEPGPITDPKARKKALALREEYAA